MKRSLGALIRRAPLIGAFLDLKETVRALRIDLDLLGDNVHQWWTEVDSPIPQLLLPYQVRPNEFNADAISKLCQRNTAHLAKVALSNDFEVYRHVTRTVALDARVDVVDVEALNSAASRNRIKVAFRHDVDGDLTAAIACAEWLRELGIPGAFYLLHTAMYYGAFLSGQFWRHSGLSVMVEKLLMTGREVGIHNDALGVCINERVDGAQALSTEIEWLRSCGATVHGTTPHNSALSYSAENFEIFKGMSFMERKSSVHKGNRVRLQAVSPACVGIRYDGTHPKLKTTCDPLYIKDYLSYDPSQDLIRNERWLNLFMLHNPLYLPGFEVSIWVLGRNKWMFARHWPEKERVLEYPLTTDEMLLRFKRLDGGVCVQFNIHPEYVGEMPI